MIDTIPFINDEGGRSYRVVIEGRVHDGEQIGVIDPYYRPEDYYWTTCGRIFMEIEEAIEAIIRRYQDARTEHSYMDCPF